MQLLQLYSDARLHSHVLVSGDIRHYAQAADFTQQGGPQLPGYAGEKIYSIEGILSMLLNYYNLILLSILIVF